MNPRRATLSRRPTPLGLMARGILPGLVATWVVTLAAVGVLLPRDAGTAATVLLALTGALTLALCTFGWIFLLRPARRLRERLADITADEPGSLRSAGRDELHDLERALASLADRLARLQGAVEREQRTFRATLESQGEPMIAVDHAGLIAFSNTAAEEFLRVPSGALRGRPLRTFLTNAGLLRALERSLAGQAFRGRITVPTERGEQVWDCAASPLPLTEGDAQGALLTLREVTELANAVRIKTDFVANASHELRTPLAAIRGAVETLQSAAGENPKVAARMFEIIAGHLARLEDLVGDLLDLSRVESGDLPLRVEPARIELIRRTLLEQFQDPCAKRGVRLILDIPGALEGWPTDPRLIVLILRNLVENASKFAHDNTDIRVLAQVEGNDPDRLVRFEVADRGIGIPLAQQQRVFERFYQVDPARPGYEHLSSLARAKRGTGLGLAIVRHAVKALGGRVGLKSIYNEGTTVWFEVPWSPPSRLESRDTPPKAPDMEA